MNKEGDKGAKKAKELNSRRLSAVNFTHATTSRTSTDTKPSPVKRGATPDSKTVTSKTRRVSAVHKPITEAADDQHIPPDSVNSPQAFTITRSSLRSRSSLASSALPKYRPKSVVLDSHIKPPSPLRAGTRRRLSGSGDENDKKGEMKSTPKQTPRTPVDTMVKPISPLPHRATFKVNLAAVNVSPSTPSKGKSSSPVSCKISPPRPMKAAKTTASSANQSAIPRPPSSASSTGSVSTPRTPKASGFKSALGLGRSSREKSVQESSPLRTAIRLSAESPLGRRSQKVSKGDSPTNTKKVPTGNMSLISEGDGDDSDGADDVEMLLAPVASLAAPTPAMPRAGPFRNRKQNPPQTPTRASTLPTRADLSYLSPTPPVNQNSPPVRPPTQDGVARPRGSILSWEQLASESSKILEEGEIDSMLSEFPAPFIADLASSNTLSVPGSPYLSALHSPGAYGSISQVLLPDVTPSPAIHHHSSRYENEPPELPAVDAAIVTLLRLQLAAAENTAKERLLRLQTLEEEIHNLKEARLRETEELGKQVSYVEEKLRGNIEARDKAEEERAAYTAALEDQIRHDQAYLDQAIENAVGKANSIAQQSSKAERRKWDSSCSARGASVAWTAVRDLAENELDHVRADLQALSVLLAGLESSGINHRIDVYCRTCGF